MISSCISNVEQTADMPAAHVRSRGAGSQRCVSELQIVGRLAVQQGRHQVPPVERSRVLAESSQG